MSVERRSYQQVHAWDRWVRVFHWVNLLCVLGMIALGTAILNAKALGVSTEGKILLKQWHVWIGYVLAVNLFWRLLWGFVGSATARWRHILPFSRGFSDELRADVRARLQGKPLSYVGHNPLGRMMVTALFAVLLVQALTGLTLAATDLYQGPLGSLVAHQVAAEGVDPNSLRTYDKTGVDPQRYDAMRAWRSPIVQTHLWLFYVLLGLIAVHIIAVVVAEVTERNSLVSAMISGKKMLAEKPVDDNRR